MLEPSELAKLNSSFPGINLHVRLRNWRDVGSLFDEIDNSGRTFAKKHNSNTARNRLLLRYLLQEKRDEMPAVAVETVEKIIADPSIPGNNFKPGIDKLKELLFDLELLALPEEGAFQPLKPTRRGEDFLVIAKRTVGPTAQWFIRPDHEYQYCVVEDRDPEFEASPGLDELVFQYNEIELPGKPKPEHAAVMADPAPPAQAQGGAVSAPGKSMPFSASAPAPANTAMAGAATAPVSKPQPELIVKGYSTWPFPKFQVAIFPRGGGGGAGARRGARGRGLGLALGRARGPPGRRLARAAHVGDAHPDVARALAAGHLRDGDVVYCDPARPHDVRGLRAAAAAAATAAAGQRPLPPPRPFLLWAVRVPPTFAFGHPDHVKDMIEAPCKTGAPKLGDSAAEISHEMLDGKKEGDTVRAGAFGNGVLRALASLDDDLLGRQSACVELQGWTLANGKAPLLFARKYSFSQPKPPADDDKNEDEDIEVILDEMSSTSPLRPPMEASIRTPAPNGRACSLSEGGLSSAKRTRSYDGKEDDEDVKKVKVEVEPETDDDMDEEEKTISWAIPPLVMKFLEEFDCTHVEALIKSAAAAAVRSAAARQALGLAAEAVAGRLRPARRRAEAEGRAAARGLRDHKAKMEAARRRWEAGFAEAAAALELPPAAAAALYRTDAEGPFRALSAASPLNRGTLVATLEAAQARRRALDAVEEAWRAFTHRLWHARVAPRSAAALTDDRCRLHKTGEDHMEHYLRHDVAKAAIASVRAAHLAAHADEPGGSSAAAAATDPAPLRVLEQIDDSYLREVDTLMYAVHIEEYLEPLQQKIRKLGSEPQQLMKNSKDTTGNRDSWTAARVAAAGCLQLCDEVMEGRADTAFAGVRPPGHHAGREETDGFCLLNNVVFCSKYIRTVRPHWRVATVDFDVHHGDGTQDIVAYLKDDQHLFATLQIVTTFRHDAHARAEAFFPGTGDPRDLDGLYNVYNHPVDGPILRKDWYKFAKVTLAKLKEFKPDILLLSAGFDAHKDDPSFQDMIEDKYRGEIDAEDYYWLTALFANFAHDHCFGRVVSCLEGGYNRDVLGPSIAAHVEALSRRGTLRRHRFQKLHQERYVQFDDDKAIQDEINKRSNTGGSNFEFV